MIYKISNAKVQITKFANCELQTMGSEVRNLIKFKKIDSPYSLRLTPYLKLLMFGFYMGEEQ